MTNSGPLLFLGIFFTLATSWLGMVFFPVAQLGGAQQETTDKGMYPSPRAGSRRSRRGGLPRQRLLRLSQPAGGSKKVSGATLSAGGGRRRTVAVDYLWDNPVMLGEARLGPDLTNFGLRQTNTAPILLHLYAPRAVSPGSTMPSYAYLFLKRQIGANPSPDALPLSGELSPGDGYEIVPRPAALKLAAYLGSLRSEEWVFELPPPEEKKKATNSVAPASVAAPAGATNSPKP